MNTYTILTLKMMNCFEGHTNVLTFVSHLGFVFVFFSKEDDQIYNGATLHIA